MKTEGWPLKTAGHMEWGPRDNNWSFKSVLAVTNLKRPMQSMPWREMSSRGTFQSWEKAIKDFFFFGICKQSAIAERYLFIKLLSIHQVFMQKTIEFGCGLCLTVSGMQCTSQHCWQAEHNQWSARHKMLTWKSCMPCLQWI